jgi:hypothetical protein
MASYYVLTSPSATDPETQTRFIRDGFSWLAFLLPVPWLLFRRLWLMAGLAVVFYLVSIIAAEYWGLDGLPVAYAFILSLWAGLEGGHVRAQALQRNGWDLKANITAQDLDEAEAIYFDGMTETMPASLTRGPSGYPSSPSSSSVALGLIGPYGGR